MRTPVSIGSVRFSCEQEAAGVFGYLAERLVPRLETPYPVDLSPDCCGMLATLCLAQVLKPFPTTSVSASCSPCAPQA